MSDETVRGELYCAACDVPLNRIVNDETGRDDCVCPNCGVTAKSEEAVREASQHFAQQRIRELTSGLKGFDTGFLKVTVDHSPEQHFRFYLHQKS